MKIKLNIVLIIVAIPMFLMGIAMTIYTSTILSYNGIDANPASIHMARAAAAGILVLGIMAWLSRNSEPSQARNPLVVGLSLYFLLQAVNDARSIVAGITAPSSWISGVGLWLVFFILTALAGWSARTES